jgi:hypothetical protein
MKTQLRWSPKRRELWGRLLAVLGPQIVTYPTGGYQHPPKRLVDWMRRLERRDRLLEADALLHPPQYVRFGGHDILCAMDGWVEVVESPNQSPSVPMAWMAYAGRKALADIPPDDRARLASREGWLGQEPPAAGRRKKAVG